MIVSQLVLMSELQSSATVSSGVEDGNTNSNLDTENNAETANRNPDKVIDGKVGEAKKDFRIFESVLYSHNYYKKVTVKRGDHNVTEALCLMCLEDKKENYLKITDNNTKALKTHLLAKHKRYSSQFNKQTAEVEQKKIDSRKQKEVALDGYKQAKLGLGEANKIGLQVGDRSVGQRRFDVSVVKYAAKTFTAFNALPNLNVVLEAYAHPNPKPKYRMKSPTFYSRQTSITAEAVQNEVMGSIKSSKDITRAYAFTSDIWTSTNLHSYISLTVHFITEDMMLVKLVPFVGFFGTQRHTGHNIRLVLEQFIENLEIDDRNIKKYIVMDNASNNKKFAEETNQFVFRPCSCHTLQLAINQSMKATVDNVNCQDFLKMGKELTHFVRKSVLRNNQLKEACCATNTKFKLPVKANDTRWYGWALCLSSVVDLKKPLVHLSFNDTSKDQDWASRVWKAGEFKLAEALSVIFNSLKTATKVWEGDSMPTINQIIVQLWNINDVLTKYSKSTDKFLADFAKVFLDNVFTRFPQCGTNDELNCIAHLLDPKYQGRDE